MQLECIEWAVEVDPRRDKIHLDSLGAQERFITDFIAPMYDEVALNAGPMSKVRSIHFTRICNPQRDEMGAYVRLRVFCVTSESPEVVADVEKRLGEFFGTESTLQRKRSNLDWPKVAEGYGGEQMADLFRDHLHRTSQTVCGLLVLKRAGVDVDSFLWPWTHFFFNNARGYGRSILELAQGAVTGFHDNI